MSGQDEIATVNRQWWEKMVNDGCGFTQPWISLDRKMVRQYARGQLEPVPEALIDMYPNSVLADVGGKDVLCLASGGGQQSAVFGLLGSRVTVVDLVEGQLAGDIRVAAHYGYEVVTIRADMRNLSGISSESFDLVYQAPSMAYVPNVRQVYSEVVRVLRRGGLYRVALTNPATQFIDMDSWDGTGYRITVPYTGTVQRPEKAGEGSIQFRHYLADIFNGLLAAGLSIQQVLEAPCHRKPNPQAVPGSWAHYLWYVPLLVAIVARKEH